MTTTRPTVDMSNLPLERKGEKSVGYCQTNPKGKGVSVNCDVLLLEYGERVDPKDDFFIRKLVRIKELMSTESSQLIKPHEVNKDVVTVA